MNIHIIYATTVLNDYTPCTFPYKAYRFSGDAAINQQILSAKEPASEYKTEAVTLLGDPSDEVIVVTEVRGLSIFSHFAFDSMRKAKEYISQHHRTSLGYFRTDTLSIA